MNLFDSKNPIVGAIEEDFWYINEKVTSSVRPIGNILHEGELVQIQLVLTSVKDDILESDSIPNYRLNREDLELYHE